MRSCVFCGCTEQQACSVVLADQPAEIRKRVEAAYDRTDQRPPKVIGCSWITTTPPICSAPACVEKRGADAAGEVFGQHCVDAVAAIAKAFQENHEFRGTVACPRCDGALEYTASKHGRRLVMRAKCQTPACLEFIT